MVVPLIATAARAAGSAAVRVAGRKIAQNAAEKGSSRIAQNTIRAGSEVAARRITKVRPSDEDYITPSSPANDNSAPPVAANDNERPVSSIQRGGAPVIENPTAVSRETEQTLPKNITDSLRNQSLVRRDRNPEDEYPDQLEEEMLVRDLEERSAIRRIQLEDQERQTQEEEEQQNEENTEKANQKSPPPFPLVAFSLCVAEWLITLTLAILFFIIGIILLPIGVALEVALEVWKIAVGTAVWFWISSYEHEHLRSLKTDTKNLAQLAKMVKLLKSPKAKRAALLGINAIPVVGELVPINAYMVFSTYMSVKKQIKKSNLSMKTQ